MNESLISGLLGAVMGGATSMEKTIAEEMAAKQKEEEEKRREERAITLAERQEAMREARKAAQEKAKMERVASYIGPEMQITPGTSPMEPEAATTSKMQLEQRLTSGIEAAISKGDTEAAKLLSDQYTKLTGEKRAQAKEERDIAKFLQEPTEKIPERIKTVEALTDRFYKQSGGQYDEQGNPTDAKALASASKKAEDYVFLTMRERIGITPGAAGGEKPPTASQRAVADRALSAALPGLAKTKDISGKDVVDQQMLGFYRGEVNKIKSENPDAVFDLNGTLASAQAKVSAAEERAKQKAANEWRAMSDADKKASGIASERAYVRKNYKSYISNYLGGAAEEERPDPLGLRIR